MKKYAFIILNILLLSACTEEPKDTSTKIKEDDEVSKYVSDDNTPLDVRAKNHVESYLQIPTTEEYSIKIYKEHLDPDGKEDAIITVNRYKFAIDEAIKAGNVNKRAAIGYMGNYNFIFYYDGGLNKISPAIPIPSTPIKELNVTFENIYSSEYKDILVDFRIRNASYRDFFTVTNHSPRRIFQWKTFDGLGDSQSEAFFFDYKLNAPDSPKDIVILKGDMITPSGNFDPNTFDPEIKKTNEKIHLFFYNAQMGKYVTEKK